jgi:SAM-dependent methyltransferase
MNDDTTRKRDAAASFGRAATDYLDSEIHSGGEDLDALASWCEGADRALDVASAAGHTAGAIAAVDVPLVVAADAAPEMVATTTTEFDRVRGVVADAERLPFADDSFDAVACRIAAHHFPDPEAFVADVARVLAPGGTFAFEDNVAPEDDSLDAFVNDIEALRDPTHVRAHRESEWRAWLEAARFSVRETLRMKKPLDFVAWVERTDVPSDVREELRVRFADAPDGAAERFDVVFDEDGRVRSFANLKLLVRATLDAE